MLASFFNCLAIICLFHISRLNLISEIEEDQFCEVAGINYELIAVVSKRIVYKHYMTESNDSCLCILLGHTTL